jgi:hypothetical protein
LENVDRLEQRHVLDDQRIRLDDRLTQPDFLRIDPTEGDDGSAHALGAKTWKGLSVLILEERRDGENGRRRNDTLAPTSMDANLEHLQRPRSIHSRIGPHARRRIDLPQFESLPLLAILLSRQFNSLILRDFTA